MPLQLLPHRGDVLPGPARRDGRLAPSPRSRPACRTRPSPSGEAPRGPASGGSGPARRPSCNCGRGPCGCAPRDRGTSPAHRSSAWGWRCRREAARLVPARCQRPSACAGSKRAGHDRCAGTIRRTAERRRSRARVRMMSSSFCTVAAATGASTQAPFWLTWRRRRRAAHRRASPGRGSRPSA